MNNKTWTTKRFYHESSGVYDANSPVYSLEDFYIKEKENKICVQLCNVTTYIALIPEQYRLFLKNYNSNRKVDIEENVLDVSISDESLENVWEEREIEYTEQTLRTIKQCSFLFFDSSDNVVNGYNHPDAQLFRTESNLISYILSYKSAMHKHELGFLPVYSAHVDVGQGCCSFVFDKKNTIGIDCSRKELVFLGNHKDYLSNIDKCIRYIQSFQNKMNDSFVFDAFVLTHAHYDHYSGIFELVRKNYINAQTDFYVNVLFKSQSVPYKNLIRLLLQRKVNIVHAIPQNSVGILSFLYPLLGTVNGNHPNEVSVISNISTPSGDFIFPGDMVSQGWYRQLSMTSRIVQNAKYFAVSHHGSSTGYLSMYFPKAPQKTVLMVRDNAYPGVPDSKLFTSTFCKNKKLISTNDLSVNKGTFYLIDLNTGNSTVI